MSNYCSNGRYNIAQHDDMCILICVRPPAPAYEATCNVMHLSAYVIKTFLNTVLYLSALELGKCHNTLVDICFCGIYQLVSIYMPYMQSTTVIILLNVNFVSFNTLV